MRINIINSQVANMYRDKRMSLGQTIHKNIAKILTAKEYKKQQELAFEKQEETLRCILAAKKEFIDANKSFQFVHQPELIDYYSYAIIAALKKYNYYIKSAKEKGMKVELWEDAWASFN